MNRYKINEIFYSLQGEGYYSGCPAVFIRFSGCNLKCPFCDTKHQDGAFMTAQEIVAEVRGYGARLVVLTGGEPSLFVDKELTDALHSIGAHISMETNGTRPVPPGVDWVTFSPKGDFVAGAEPVIAQCDELKLVFNGKNSPDKWARKVEARYLYLQPCDTGKKAENKKIIEGTVAYCLAHPAWRLSLQTQKILEVR